MTARGGEEGGTCSGGGGGGACVPNNRSGFATSVRSRRSFISSLLGLRSDVISSIKILCFCAGAGTRVDEAAKSGAERGSGATQPKP